MVTQQEVEVILLHKHFLVAPLEVAVTFSSTVPVSGTVGGFLYLLRFLTILTILKLVVLPLHLVVVL